jgi:glutamine amidotransferase
MITIIDIGFGNLGSIYNMFTKVGAESKITSDLNEIKKAEKILLPGVGAFDNAMKYIIESGLNEILKEKVLNEKIPILGICLGMQLLTNSSEEGNLPGLGFINAGTFKFRFNGNENLRVPHMGWDSVIKSNESTLTENLPDDPKFYFVHSYYVKINDEADSILKTVYGITFDSAIQRENIFGAQFHPEKSHKYGMKLFDNFAKI